MKDLLWRTVPLLMIITITACANNGRHEEPAGGPCSYDEFRVPARIIAIDELDSNTYDVTMKLDSNEYMVPPYDTLSIYMEISRYLTRAEVDSLDLKKGKALTYQLLRIKSGSCNPEINTLLLETME